mmetsp:Transcript_43155/g.80120  ORF Transcript_43155/g.80120 Transcript_43155/m.80120 type:complete len:255 (+) Transcript_43155:1419-2183(+)
MPGLPTTCPTRWEGRRCITAAGPTTRPCEGIGRDGSGKSSNSRDNASNTGKSNCSRSWTRGAPSISLTRCCAETPPSSYWPTTGDRRRSTSSRPSGGPSGTTFWTRTPTGSGLRRTTDESNTRKRTKKRRDGWPPCFPGTLPAHCPPRRPRGRRRGRRRGPPLLASPRRAPWGAPSSSTTRESSKRPRPPRRPRRPRTATATAAAAPTERGGPSPSPRDAPSRAGAHSRSIANVVWKKRKEGAQKVLSWVGHES